VQIIHILDELGIKYNVYGKEATAACPYHSPDRHPSWYINLRTGLHHCFSCGARGNLAHLVSHQKGIPYPQSVIYVNEIVGWAKADQWIEDYEAKNFAPPSFKISEADMAMFTDIPEEILTGRNINPDLAKKFGVRWNAVNRSWILPIRDPYSYELWGWQEKFNDTRLFRNYPAGIRKSKTLFGLDSFADGSTAILVESPLDAVRVSDFGAGCGLASSGLQISDTQLSLVFERADVVALTLDSDSAGIRETARICRECRGRAKIWVFSYDHVLAKDPGDMNDIEIILGFANMRSGIWWLNNNQEKIKKAEAELVKGRTS